MTLAIGAGYVKKVGSAVKVAKVGDPVLLSFAHCDNCDFCKTGRPSYCTSFAENIAGATDVFEDVAGPEQGQFYGQSSFSSLSIVKESSVVDVKGLIKSDDDLKLFAPLGCGLQTGAGAVTILGQAGKADVVVVAGIGGVGLGSIMAAKIAGCKMVCSFKTLIEDSRRWFSLCQNMLLAVHSTGSTKEHNLQRLYLPATPFLLSLVRANKDP